MLLDINNLYYYYDGHNYVFENYDFVIKEEDKIWLKGPNGSGKSTLLKILAHVISDKNLSYELIYKGKATDLNTIKSEVIYIPDKVFLLDALTGNENINFYKLLWKEDDLYFERVHMHCERFFINGYLDLPVESYSLGTKQKLFLATLLARKGSLLLLDEPFNSLDVESQSYLTNSIMNDCDKSIVFVSHMLPRQLSYNKEIVLTI